MSVLSEKLNAGIAIINELSNSFAAMKVGNDQLVAANATQAASISALTEQVSQLSAQVAQLTQEVATATDPADAATADALLQGLQTLHNAVNPQPAV